MRRDAPVAVPADSEAALQAASRGGGEDTEYDVIVIGGGPAGSTVASLLAARGHHVLVLERAAFPRPKPCGESVNPGAVRELAALGALDEVRALPHAEVGGWRILPVMGPAFEGRFPEGQRGIAVARDAFDRVLLDRAAAAGAEVATGRRVADLLACGGAVRGVVDGEGRRVTARFVVGADGLRSVAVRRLGLLRRPPRLRKVALTAHVAGWDAGHGGEMHLLPGGCVGIAPVGDGVANVVVVVNGGASARIGGDRDGFFDETVRAVSALSAVRRIGPVRATGPFDWPTRGVTAAGALLVGDAAGYYDPFTGQGIYRALRGARFAAVAVDALLLDARRAPAALRAYERAHRREIARGVWLQRAIEAATTRPRLFAPLAAAFHRWPAAADRMIAATGNLGPARNFLRGPPPMAVD